MHGKRLSHDGRQPAGALRFLSRLARDRAGNTLAMVAAAILPILAMVGGGIDMGRGYMAESRLQQACDAGVLAARKQLGSQAVITGEVPDAVANVGNRFFNINFRNGSYGTEGRAFQMALEEDYSISGQAQVTVPTSIMRIFGYEELPIAVRCTAQLNFSNTDVMMVLDTTGSMNWTNPDDSETRIQVLRSVVKNFHAQLEGAKSPGTRIRYGFVPYSTNVNVGWLLRSDWVVDTWQYQGREREDTGRTILGPVFRNDYTYVSGGATGNPVYTATSCPADTARTTQLGYWIDSKGVQHWEYLVNGTTYSCSYPDGGQLQVNSTTYSDYRYIYNYQALGMKQLPVYTWRYKPISVDVTPLKGASGDDPLVGGAITLPMGGAPDNPTDHTAWFRGCMEERSTYAIDDYDAVDFTRALDLDLDRVPDPADPDTQWRPMLNEFSFIRSIDWSGRGTFTATPVASDSDYLVAAWAGLSACPTEARLLAEMSASDVASYVDSLVPQGSTYHDIGMIWGGRLLSPTGLFASENADVDGKPTSRHLIFLTDGETSPLDLSYGTYGIEPLDQRRWAPGSSQTLTETVESRFAVACNEVKKRNITVWFVAFGTDLNPVFTQCAGQGHYFAANDAAELDDVFSNIAKSIGDLRISR